MKYIKNKYYYTYISIISKAKQENRVKHKGTYYENHHIFPKAIYPKYSKSLRNQVLLTAKEHFVCHHLLTKFTIGKGHRSMVHAFWGMCNQRANGRDYKVSASVYDNIRQLHSARVSAIHKNKVVSQATRDKISSANTGKKRSDAFKQRRREYMLGRPNPHKGESGWTPTPEQNLHKSKVLSGEKNYQFNGYYHTPFGSGPSLRYCNLPKICNESCTIRKWCRSSDKIISNASFIQQPYLKSLGSEIIGKTFKEIGFWFEAV